MTQLEKPEIKTELPGPKARQILERHRKYISPSYPRAYDLVAERAEGVWVWDVDGNKFLDMVAGVAVNSTGHSHPKIVKAIKEQVEKLIHISTDFYHEVEVKLAEKLSSIFPSKGNNMVFFTNSGTESNEGALKLAKFNTKRIYILAFEGSFHGRTYASMSVSASKTVHKRYFGPLMPGVFFVPFPNSYRPPFNAPADKASDQLIDYIENTLFARVVPPEEVAAFIFEPIQGEGGYVFPLEDFFPKLRKLADKYGFLLIDDEVQAGLGRTGKWFAIEHYNTQPDIITIAKGIASGIPMGAFIAREGLMDRWPMGAHANTFGGNPVAAASALATLELIENELMENARIVGEYYLQKLKELQREFEEIGDVRGKGLMIGVEFVKDRETKEYYPEFRDKVVLKSFQKGVLFLGCGPSALRIVPPLIITKEHVDVAVDILAEAIKEAREEVK